MQSQAVIHERTDILSLQYFFNDNSLVPYPVAVARLPGSLSPKSNQNTLTQAPLVGQQTSPRQKCLPVPGLPLQILAFPLANNLSFFFNIFDTYKNVLQCLL